MSCRVSCWNSSWLMSPVPCPSETRYLPSSLCGRRCERAGFRPVWKCRSCGRLGCSLGVGRAVLCRVSPCNDGCQHEEDPSETMDSKKTNEEKTACSDRLNSCIFRPALTWLNPNDTYLSPITLKSRRKHVNFKKKEVADRKGKKGRETPMRIDESRIELVA